MPRNAVTSAGSNVYAYDPNGNMILMNGGLVGWTIVNRMKAIETPRGNTVNFNYDPISGARYLKTVTTGVGASIQTVSSTVYFDGEFEGKSDSTGTITKTYIHALGKLVAVETKPAVDGNVLFMYTDRLGSIDTIADKNGSVIE
jgi:hypothetical protein